MIISGMLSLELGTRQGQPGASVGRKGNTKKGLPEWRRKKVTFSEIVASVALVFSQGLGLDTEKARLCPVDFLRSALWISTQFSTWSNPYRAVPFYCPYRLQNILTYVFSLALHKASVGKILSAPSKR